MLRGVGGNVVAEVSGLCTEPFIRERRTALPLEQGVDTLSRKVANLPLEFDA